MYQQNTILLPQHTTRVRWSRIVIVGAIAVVGLMLWLNGQDKPVPKPTPQRQAPVTVQPKVAAPEQSVSRPSARARVKNSQRRAAKRRAAAAAATRRKARAANARKVAALPYTGAPVWFAMLLGTVLLVGGVTMQRRADNVEVFAATHRRGPLLRTQSYVDAGVGARQKWQLATYLLRAHHKGFVKDWRAHSLTER